MKRRPDANMVAMMRSYPAELAEAYRQHFGNAEPPPPPAPLAKPVRRSTVGLTAQQGKAYVFIWDFSAEHGRSPTFDEIREALGLTSKGGVHRLLTGLEERGWIRRMPNRPRSIMFLEACP